MNDSPEKMLNSPFANPPRVSLWEAVVREWKDGMMVLGRWLRFLFWIALWSLLLQPLFMIIGGAFTSPGESNWSAMISLAVLFLVYPFIFASSARASGYLKKPR